MAPHGTPHGCTTAVGFYQGCLYLVRGPAPTGFNPNAKTTIPEVKSSGRSRTVYLESKFLFHRKTLGLFGRHTLAIFLFYFIFPCLLLSSSFSFSYFLPRRNYSDAGSCSSLPPPTVRATRFHPTRGSSLADSGQLLHTHARRSRQLLSSENEKLLRRIERDINQRY